MFKCNPSFHKHSLVMLTLLVKWNLLLLYSSRKWSLTCLMILVSLNCLLINIEEIITSFTPYRKHLFPMSIIRFEMSFASILLVELCIMSFETPIILCNVILCYIINANVTKPYDKIRFQTPTQFGYWGPVFHRGIMYRWLP